MARIRPPDWLIFLGVVGALIGAAVLLSPAEETPSQERAPPSAPPRAASRPLPPATVFDPAIVVAAPELARPGAGTAFSISEGGVWLTARHVVEGCARTAIVVAPGEGVAAEVRIDPRGETAVLITQGGAPALPMAPRQSLRRGLLAVEPGFPQGKPGEVLSRLVRRETLVLRGRRTRRESVLAWSEVRGGSGFPANLAGLSGAPALDSLGRVIGVTVAQSRRRGRIYTTTPSALRGAIARAQIGPASGAIGPPITPANYHDVAADLRRDLRVVPVECLPR